MKCVQSQPILRPKTYCNSGSWSHHLWELHLCIFLNRFTDSPWIRELGHLGVIGFDIRGPESCSNCERCQYLGLDAKRGEGISTSVCEAEEDWCDGNEFEKCGDSTETIIESVWKTKSVMSSSKDVMLKMNELTQRMEPCYPSTIDPFGSYSSSSTESTTNNQYEFRRLQISHTLVWTIFPLVFPWSKTKMTVPTTGIKFKGKYITYLIKAAGVNFSNGLLTNFPNLAIGSLKFPLLTSRPSASMPVWCLATRTPSNVSTRASWMRKVRERMLIRVEDSERTRRMVVNAASGPFTNTRTASCGR